MISLRQRLHVSSWAIAMAGGISAAPALAVEAAPAAPFGADAAGIEPAVVVGETFAATGTGALTVALPDGTRVIVGEGGTATVAAYSWSAASGTGRIELRLDTGTYQIAAGQLGGSGDIVIRVGQGTIRIFAATAIVVVVADGTVRAYMTAGDRLVVAAAGVVRMVEQPGVEIVLPAEGVPLTPRQVPPEQVAADLAALGDTGAAAAANLTLGDVSFAGGSDTRREPAVSPLRPEPTGGPHLDRAAYEVALSYAPGIGARPAGMRDVSGSTATIGDAVSFSTIQTDSTWTFSGSDVGRTAELLQRSPGPITNRVIVGRNFVTGIGENNDNPAMVVDPAGDDSGNAIFGESESLFQYGFLEGADSFPLGPILVLDTDFLPDDHIIVGHLPRKMGIVEQGPIRELGSGFPLATNLALQTGFVSIILPNNRDEPFTISNTGTPFDGIDLKNVDGSESFDETSTGIVFRQSDNFMLQQIDERTRPLRVEVVRGREKQVGFDRAKAWAALYFDHNWNNFDEEAVRDVERILIRTENDSGSTAAQLINNRLGLSPATGEFVDQFQVSAARTLIRGGAHDIAPLLSTLFGHPEADSISDEGVSKLLAAVASFEGQGPITPADLGLPASSPEIAALGHGGLGALSKRSGDLWFGKQTGASIVFAAGDVDGKYRRPGSPRVDRFFTSAGLSDFSDRQNGAAVARGIRAFLPIETAFARRGSGGRLRDFGIPLVDSGVLLSYGSRAAPSAGKRNGYADGEVIAQIAHADLGIKGMGPNQRSTFSITVGQVDRHRVNHVESRLAGDAGAHDAFLTAHTFGSSRDRVDEEGQRPASTFFSSPQASTAAGGGNPDLIDATGKPLSGTPGYFVVESYDPLEKDARLTGGVARALGGPDRGPRQESRFASLRLLSGTGSLTRAGRTGLRGDFHGIELSQRTPGLALEGFAAGLAEFETSDDTIGVGFADAFGAGGKNQYASNLSIAARPEANRLTATLKLTDPNGVSRARVLGGDDVGTSAFFDDRVFAARSEAGARTGDHALVSGQLVTIGKGRRMALPGLGTVGTNRHVAWGLFLADRIWQRSGDRREHVHMGAWVAGDPTERNRYRDFTGEAEYSGPAIGNAYDGRAVTTVVGSFRNKWDFGKKTGSFDLEFDQRRYTGATRFKEGRGFVSDDLRAPGRIGRVDGDFFGPMTTGRGGVRSPAAIGGQFAISGRGREIYRASGVFFGKRCRRC